MRRPAVLSAALFALSLAASSAPAQDAAPPKAYRVMLVGNSLTGSSNLLFNDLVTFNIRTFIDFNQRPGVTESVPLLENVRLSFRLDNLFDKSYQIADGYATLGRTVFVTLRWTQ